MLQCGQGRRRRAESFWPSFNSGWALQPAGFRPPTKLATTETAPSDCSASSSPRSLRSSWKIKEIQHPRVGEAFNLCSASALIFHGLLVLILVGIIDLERALPHKNERLWGAGQKRKEKKVLLWFWRLEILQPFFVCKWLWLQFSDLPRRRRILKCSCIQRDKMLHSLFNS